MIRTFSVEAETARRVRVDRSPKQRLEIALEGLKSGNIARPFAGIKLLRICITVGRTKLFREHLGRRKTEHRRERIRASEANQIWSLDLMADQLTNWRRFRVLSLVDVFTRECLAIEVGPSQSGLLAHQEYFLNPGHPIEIIAKRLVGLG